MTPAEIYQTMVQAGFSGQQAVTMTAIALAESSGNPGATHTNSNGSIDRGLTQVNSVHSQYDPNKLVSDPLYNAQAAFQIAGGGKSFGPWSTYNSGAYQKYMSTAQAAASGGGGGAITSDGTTGAAAPQPQDLGTQLKMASDAAAGGHPVEANTAATPEVPGGTAPSTPAPESTPQSPTAGATTAPTSGPAATAIQTAIQAAQNKTPYVWGGNSLQQGVDCSGLIQEAYKSAGINLPRVSDAQINSGQHIDPSQMQAGDLLGWAYNNSLGGGATHVAMYIGGGMMVEALHKGEPVHIVPVRAPQFVTRVSQGTQAPAGQQTATQTAQQQPQNSPDDSLQARLAAISNAFGGSFSAPGATK